ncbi:phospholipase D-like domain-containing protein [Halobellus salinisoli]|uniref:phospholipase D-like domain-containing protein n=1 Tax=Halobellus salinisoli TaxID=3108500 RepID=UPI00300AD404
MPTNHLDPDADALLETARIINQSVSPAHLDSVRASLEYLYHGDGDVTPESLQDTTHCNLSTTESENIVYQLAVENIVTKDHINEPALRSAFTGARLLAAQAPEPENTIVATIPDDDALDAWMFEALHGNILELIRSAEDTLVLMSPFLSEDAYNRLRPALVTAADNGADITLITRYLTYGDEDYNREFVRAVLNDDRLAPQVTTYEYIDDSTWTTFHAKVVIADGVRAYLGTANLTHKGLGGNLELGVIFRDETAPRLTELVEALRASEYLHEVSLRRSQFNRL